MGFFKSIKARTEMPSSTKQENRTRYVSPTLEKIPSDLSKNKVPTSPDGSNRHNVNSSLRALPPTPRNIQSPYAQNNDGEEFHHVEEQPNTEELVAASTSDSQSTEGAEDEEMVMVRPRKGARSDKRDDEVSDVGPVDTGDEQSELPFASGKTHTSHLNSLFNGHLMKWKFDAEEGPGYIRIPAFLAGLGLIATTTTALVLYPITWTVSSIVISVFVYISAIMTVILDGRFLSSSPLSIRAHLRNVITRNFGIFRYLWGRGILYLAGAVSFIV